jgi:hypothetical protein
MAIDNVRVNGNDVSWGSIVLKINEERLYGFTSINYADKRERDKSHGQDRAQRPRARSRGKYTTEPIKLVGFKESFRKLRAAIANAAGGNSFGDFEFEIQVQFVENGEAHTDGIHQVVWEGNSSTFEEGPDSLKEEVTLDAMWIDWDGLTLFSEAS